MFTRDITTQFRTATQHIVPGTLVQDDHFSLFESVGALEIGDPKMDSGCLEPGESLDEEFDISRDFLPEELIWLMDEILNRQVAWLMGYPLSQTLFTSVHIDRLLWPDPKSLDQSTFIRGIVKEHSPLSHSLLRAYCFVLLKSCDLILGTVKSQHFYEEEDFTTQLFNRELLHRFPSGDISEVAIACLDTLIDLEWNIDHREAISARLSFHNHILGMLMKHVNGESPPSSLFSFLHGSIDDQQKNHKLGKQVPGAFSTKLQRRLASTVPPRPMVTVSMDDAWTFWHQTLDDCKNVFSIHQAGHSQDLFTAYQIFAYSVPQPSVYPRVLLQAFLTSANLVASRVDSMYFLEEDLQSLTLPVSQLLIINKDIYGKPNHGNTKVADCMQDFVDRFGLTFGNLYRALCLNSCRIRRTFCQALLEWDNLQSQAEDFDTIIQEAIREKPTAYLPGSPPTFSFSLSSWVYHHKLNILRLTIQMGFELTIYAPYEMAAMYWYLSSTCDIHLSHLERISHFVMAKDTEIKHSKMSSAVKHKGTRECRMALDRLYRQYAWVKATQLLAGTMHGIYIVLQRCGVFLPPEPRYSEDKVRYEIRMKPFLGLSIPEQLSYEDFNREVQMESINTEEVLSQATSMAADAKKAWEQITKTSWNVFEKVKYADESPVLDEKWTADVKNCLKATIAASLCVLSLKKAVVKEEWKAKARKETKLPGPGEKGRWHRWWIVPFLPPA